MLINTYEQCVIGCFVTLLFCNEYKSCNIRREATSLSSIVRAKEFDDMGKEFINFDI